MLPNGSPRDIQLLTKPFTRNEFSGVLGKAESTICEILSLTRLPDAVKDDCRNDPKAPRRVLAEIAKQRTAVKMHALYEKYKASGLTRGELRGNKTTLRGAAVEAAAEAAAAAPIDLAFVQRFTKHLDELEIGKLDRPQSIEFLTHLDTLRLSVNRKLKVLKNQAQR